MRVQQLLALLLLGAISLVQAAEESCEGNCFQGFIQSKKCQCDIMCTYYQSCCDDYVSVCQPKQTRGDVFTFPEDEFSEEASKLVNETDIETTTSWPTTSPQYNTITATGTTGTTGATTEHITAEPEGLCSGKSFDAFTNLKNGTIYAFRGLYYYELDDKKALEGYPKLIKDVWGIDGPIDAAFTRINCQGKTYLFKGSIYWRFTDGILDPQYPREISEGFTNIPDDIDAALALPANDHLDREKVYFFKGKKYWQYEFKQQPSWEECLQSSPSELFTQYVRVKDDSMENFFEGLFGTWRRSNTEGPWDISRHWKGVPSNVDAVLPSRIYIPKETRSSSRRYKKKNPRRRKSHKRRPSRSISWFDDILDDTIGILFDDYDDEISDPDWLPPVSPPQCQAIQSAYFFKNDKYYRVNLQRKSVDKVYPRYPRSIGKYWLGCVTE
ncbi:vitronectin [Pelodytes ibericus]